MKPSIIALFAALFAAPIGGGALADDAPPVPAIFTIIPQSGLQALQGKVRFVGTFEPSGSTWTDGLDERDVFLAAMEGEGWRIGIGKGGQLYSVRGPFGESVPPQRLDSPWNDEVWQMVLTVEEIIRPIHDFQKQGREQRMATMPLMYFIHQSGIYVKGQSDGIDSGSVDRPFYSPVLRQHWDPATRTFHVVNWAQQARTPCVWKSGALIYTAYRDLGGGALEVTQVLHHFGDQTITYINAPWGGVRHSALPHAILSKPDGTWEEVEGGWGADTALRKLRDTGGWEAWVRNPDQGESPALALVFGTEPELRAPGAARPSLVRWGTAGNVEVRDYQVTEQISKPRLEPGGTLAARWFLVSGSFDDVRRRAEELAPEAGVWTPVPDASAAQEIWMSDGRPATTGEGKPAFELHAQPLPGTVPFFLMKDTRSGEIFVTTDPYVLTDSEPFANPLPNDHPEHSRYEGRVVYHQYSSRGVFLDLLGYAFPKEPPTGVSERVEMPGYGSETFPVWTTILRH